MAASTTMTSARGLLMDLSSSASDILFSGYRSCRATTSLHTSAIKRSAGTSFLSDRLSAGQIQQSSLPHCLTSSFLGVESLRHSTGSAHLRFSKTGCFHCGAHAGGNGSLASAEMTFDGLNGYDKNSGSGHVQFHSSALAMEYEAKAYAESDVESEDDDYLDDEEVPEKDDLAVENLGLSPVLSEALIKRGILRLFDIQQAVMKPAMAGRDLIARARTGTGKTLAFGIPILERITQENLADRSAMRPGRPPRCMVLAPTRELAKQVEREFAESAPHLAVLCVYGGVSIDGQIRQLRKGVDITVGTPGRITDLMERKALDLRDIRFLVLDEADQMLAVGFEEDVERILEQMPDERQSQLFSATMPFWVKKLARKYLNDPVTIDLVGDSKEKLAEGIKLMCVRSPMNSKRSILTDLITVHAKGGKTIVFTQTKRDADDVSSALGRTVGCEALHGDIAQHQREKTLQAFRNGRFAVLVATDVASRGLDIPNVDLVIHYEVPNDSETFVHRSGRTGRAGKLGSAILMHTDSQIRTLKNIERDTGCRFQTISPPQVDEVLSASSDQAMQVIERVHPEVLEAFLPAAEKMLAERGAHALAAAIAHMSGFDQPPASKSLLTYETGWTTMRMIRSETSGRGPLVSARHVTGALAEAYPAAADALGKIRLISDRNVEGAVFDVPEKIAKDLMTMQMNSELPEGDVYDIPKELPRLMEMDMGSSRGIRGDSYGRSSGGRYGGRAGGSSEDRYSRRPDRQGGSGSIGRGASAGSGGRWDSWGSSRPTSRRSFGTDVDPWNAVEQGGWVPQSGAGYERRERSGYQSRGGRAPFEGTCFVCKQPGHRAVDCPSAR